MELSPDERAALSASFAELDARITVNRFLLEHLFASVYGSRPEAFDAFIADAQESLLTAVRPVAPMSGERIEDLQVRISVHLERFRQATLRRIGPT